MKRIRSYWKILTHIGTNASMSYIEFKRVHMINLIVLLCIPPTIYFFITNLVEQRVLLSVINLSNTLSSLSVLFFLYYKKHNYAKFVLLTSNFVFLFVGALLYRNGAEYFLLCILIASMLLYDNRGIHILFGLAVVSAIALIYIFPDINDFERPVPTHRVILNISCSIIFIIASVNFFLQIIYSNMQKIEAHRLTLQAVNSDKEKIFSIIAHDIKSPFATLETMVFALEKQVLNNKTSLEFIRQLHLRIVQQNQVLDDLLQWGSSSLQNITDSPHPITIRPVIHDILNLFELQIKIKQLNININISNEEQVVVNKDHFVIILRNLISNAIKFSYVTGDINIFTSFDKNYRYIHIKDQGIGINPSKSALLFNVIQRKSLGTEDEPGTGIGLVLCKDLIERNNGIVYINSTPNKGSIFTVGLPNVTGKENQSKDHNDIQEKRNKFLRKNKKSLEMS